MVASCPSPGQGSLGFHLFPLWYAYFLYKGRSWAWHKESANQGLGLQKMQLLKENSWGNSRRPLSWGRGRTRERLQEHFKLALLTLSSARWFFQGNTWLLFTDSLARGQEYAFWNHSHALWGCMTQPKGLPTGTWSQASPLPSSELPCTELSFYATKFGSALLLATRQVPSPKDRGQQVS